MKILTQWLRDYLPGLSVSDSQLADDLTLRGIAVEGVFDLGPGNGSLFETDITTNRVDAMNHYGVAREAAAIYGLTLAPLDTALPEDLSSRPDTDFDLSSRPKRSVVEGSAFPASGPISVTIEAPDLCGRFTARVLRDVTIQPSSTGTDGLVASRFNLLEQKQISNAVDATNYVLLAMGQPTHAFDLDKLEGGITVRRAHKGERLKLLDGTDRTLDADDLVVADEAKALALAGVMGGWDSMITAETKNILVEAAWFDPAAIRRSSRRHNIHTDASHRFERGADFNAAPIGNALVTKLILASGGYQQGAFIDIVIPEAERRTATRPAIQLAVSEVRRLLGTTEDGLGISAQTTEHVLTALGCTLSPAEDETYSVTLPSWRLDLEREIDLVEEVARVYGYNRFANTLPTFAGTVIELPHATRHSTVRELLLASGLNEAVTSTFCGAAAAGLFAPQPSHSIAIGNPLSAEAGMLRPSLLPGLINATEQCLNRNISNVRLFEIGTAFSGSTDRVDEKPALAFAITGHAPSAGPHHTARPFDFYDAKGIVEALIAKFQHKASYVDAVLLPAWLHPGRSARCVIDGFTIGYFGQLHPSAARQHKLRQDLFIGEFYLDRLFALPLRQPRLQELSRYQAVARDFSFLVPDTLRWEQLSAHLRALNIPELLSFTPQEIFRPEKGEGKPSASLDQQHYSLLLSTIFQATDRTLKDEELQAWSQRIVGTVEALGGRLRG
jgi:phenylalanyl-tRNA synthetase beta chain